MISVVQYYRVTWQILIILAAALAVGSAVVRPQVLIPFFLIAFVRMTKVSGVLSANRRRLSWGIGIALFLLSIHQIMRFSRFEDLIEVMIEMISGTLPLMILNHEKPRSYWLSILNVTVVAIGSITFASSVPIYLGFILFVGVMLLNLNAASLYQAAAEGRALPRGYFQQFGYVLPAGVLAAAAIFMTFPRVQTFSLSLGSLMAKSRAGYSGGISLSGDGEIENTGDLAFMVDAPDKIWLKEAAPKFLFRGDALDTFDGQRWSSNVFNFRTKEQAADLRTVSRHSPETRTLTLHMEPTPNNAVFYPGVLVHVVDKSASAGGFLYNANGSVIRDTYSLERYSYAVKVAEPYPATLAPSWPLAELPARVVTRALQDVFPHEMAAKDLESYLEIPTPIAAAPWFQSWVREVGVDPAVDTMATLDRKLHQHFTATFKATMKNSFSQPNALAAFLSTDRQGHCEYFATATALLLRSLGVPSRVVVGFRGGHYNDLIDVVEVTEDDAHAWVEAFIPEHGWQALDPTPESREGGAGRTATATLRRYVNAMSFWFRQYVVDYDQRTQRDLIKSLRELATRDKDESGEWKSALLRSSREIAVGVSVLIFGITAFFGLRRRRVARAWPAYYREYLRIARRFELERGVAETFREFHARAVAAGVDGELTARVDRALEAEFYGTGVEPGEAEALVLALKS